MDELQEFIVFTVESKDGTEVEMAVVDEFDFEDQHYVVGALVEGDSINGEGLYIYRAKMDGDEDFVPEKILDAAEYNKIAAAYVEMDAE